MLLLAMYILLHWEWNTDETGRADIIRLSTTNQFKPYITSVPLHNSQIDPA
jgi:hypothetical protein